MKNKLISILLGSGAGVVNALVLLCMMNMTGFRIKSSGFLLCIIAAAALPLSLNLFERVKMIDIFLSQCVMTGASFIITCLYAFYVSHASELVSIYSNFFIQVVQISAVLHIVSLCSVLAVHFFNRKKDSQ